MNKLTREQVEELRGIKSKELGGDLLFWDKMLEIYADDKDLADRIKFEKKYLLSVKAIPLEFGSHWKTSKQYMETVEEFYEMVGYTDTDESVQEYEDNLLEKIAAKLGIDIDINGDGMTSFEKYRRAD